MTLTRNLGNTVTQYHSYLMWQLVCLHKFWLTPLDMQNLGIPCNLSVHRVTSSSVDLAHPQKVGWTWAHLDNSANVAGSLGEVQGTQLGGSLALLHVRLEHGTSALTLCTNNATHCCKSRIHKISNPDSGDTK